MFPLGDDDTQRRSAPVVTVVLISLNLLVFFVELNGGEAFIQLWAFVPRRFGLDPSDQALTILSAMFMHGGWMHLFGNMLYLWIFGDNVEDALGKVKFLFALRHVRDLRPVLRQPKLWRAQRWCVRCDSGGAGRVSPHVPELPGKGPRLQPDCCYASVRRTRALDRPSGLQWHRFDRGNKPDRRPGRRSVHGACWRIRRRYCACICASQPRD
jgi:Rhomboid family